MLHASTDFAPRIIDISRLSWPFYLVVHTILPLVVTVLCMMDYAKNARSDAMTVANDFGAVRFEATQLLTIRRAKHPSHEARHQIRFSIR